MAHGSLAFGPGIARGRSTTAFERDLFDIASRFVASRPTLLIVGSRAYLALICRAARLAGRGTVKLARGYALPDPVPSHSRPLRAPPLPGQANREDTPTQPPGASPGTIGQGHTFS